MPTYIQFYYDIITHHIIVYRVGNRSSQFPMMNKILILNNTNSVNTVVKKLELNLI